MRIIYISILLLLGAWQLMAQIPSPAPVQDKPIAIVGGTVHVGDGTVIENGVVIFEKGKIVEVGKSGEVEVDIDKQKLVEAEGKHIYPGLILPHSEIGLEEISAVKATLDNREIGSFNPNVRSIIAYNTDSELISTLKYNGIAIAQVAPGGGGISGTSSIVQLDAWNWEDAAYKMDDGIHMSFPRRIYPPRWWRGETESRPNPNYNKQVAAIEKAFADAQAYSKSEEKEVNVALASMKGLFDGTQTLYIRVNQAKDILASIMTVKKAGVQKVVIIGGYDAPLVTDFLKQNDVSVILTQVHSLPNRAEDDVNRPFQIPALLKEAGVKFCLAHNGDMLSTTRNLAFFAGTAAAHGLSKEEALQAITSDAAMILGIADKTGALKVGLDANIVISEGDLLDMRSNQIDKMFIQGRDVDLNGRQQMLYEKYKAKYKHED